MEAKYETVASNIVKNTVNNENTNEGNHLGYIGSEGTKPPLITIYKLPIIQLITFDKSFIRPYPDYGVRIYDQANNFSFI